MNNKLRKALTKILNLTNSLDEDCAVDPVEIRDIASDALAEPMKNYEVGTAEEQEKRFCSFCKAAETFCAGCEVNVMANASCFAIWAQMPYEAEKGEVDDTNG